MRRQHAAHVRSFVRPFVRPSMLRTWAGSTGFSREKSRRIGRVKPSSSASRQSRALNSIRAVELSDYKIIPTPRSSLRDSTRLDRRQKALFIDSHRPMDERPATNARGSACLISRGARRTKPFARLEKKNLLTERFT